jgi:hypothetical protein
MTSIDTGRLAREVLLNRRYNLRLQPLRVYSSDPVDSISHHFCCLWNALRLFHPSEPFPLQISHVRWYGGLESLEHLLSTEGGP